jgi:methyl coenzyme M reductase system subunit A2
MDFVRNVCDRAMLMRNGKRVITGLPEEVLAKITAEEQQELLGS